MSSKNVGSVALVILLGLIIGVLGIVADDLYTVGALILIIGGVGAAVLAGEYLIRYLGRRRPPALRAAVFVPFYARDLMPTRDEAAFRGNEGSEVPRGNAQSSGSVRRQVS
jgi:O-antigen/teichoic acid export membrane protein